MPRVLMAVLFASIEGDTGVWEYPGEITGALGRHEITDSDRSAARLALTLFVIDELVDMFRQDPAWTGDLVLVPVDEAMSVLAETDFAIPSRSQIDHRCYITLRGVKVFTALSAVAKGELSIEWFTSTRDDARIVESG